jgi:prepilin-type processing-associated H-X9-DG protein
VGGRMFWAATRNSQGPITLLDLLQKGGPVVGPPLGSRHRGSTNVAFADGHVESVSISDVARRDIYLSE